MLEYTAFSFEESEVRISRLRGKDRHKWVEKIYFLMQFIVLLWPVNANSIASKFWGENCGPGPSCSKHG